MIRDHDRLLATRGEFLLGRRISDARSSGTSPSEKDLFERNLRTQITTWSGTDTDLHEYTHRQWAGLTTTFYLPRWQMFIDGLKLSLRENREPRNLDYFKFEKAWTEGREYYSVSEIGDTLRIAEEIYRKYASEVTDK